MNESAPAYISCASGNNAFTDCLVVARGDLIRLIGHSEMDFTRLGARNLALKILELVGDDLLPKFPNNDVKPLRRARKLGGDFQHTGTIIGEVQKTTGEWRVVLEFDAPTQGMLHIYRPDQVETINAPPVLLDSGDEVVESVRHKYVKRAVVGQKKYGQKMTREDLSLKDWLMHHQEELMDATLYTEAEIRRLDRMQDDGK